MTWEHGTINAYANHRCRCQPCRDAHAAEVKDRRLRRKSERVLDANGRWVATGDVVHGKESTYSNYRCQCGPCREAYNTAELGRRRRRKKTLAGATTTDFSERTPSARAQQAIERGNRE